MDVEGDREEPPPHWLIKERTVGLKQGISKMMRNLVRVKSSHLEDEACWKQAQVAGGECQAPRLPCYGKRDT